jgi:DNA polymerase
VTDLASLPLYDAVSACTACDIRREAKRPLPPEGLVSSTTLVVGQNPGQEEERSGRLFVGRAGKELDEWFRLLRVDRSKVAIMNIVACRTLKNRTPRKAEAQRCAGRWLPEVLAAMPNLAVILALGRPARMVVLPGVEVPLLDMVAVTIRHDATNRVYTVYPLVHPAYLLRCPGERPRHHAVLRAVRAHWIETGAYDAVRS